MFDGAVAVAVVKEGDCIFDCLTSAPMRQIFVIAYLETLPRMRRKD